MIGDLKKKKRRKFRVFSKRKTSKSKIIDSFIEFLEEEYSIDLKDIKERISRKEKKIDIPVSIFDNKLSALEAIVKYLKENKKFRYSIIALLLNRDDRTIWYSYNQSRKKLPKKLKIIKKKKKVFYSLINF